MKRNLAHKIFSAIAGLSLVINSLATPLYVYAQESPTPTPTDTPTATPTETPTVSPTETPTATPTDIASPTASPETTVAPTDTPIDTPTVSPEVTTSGEPTVSESAQPQAPPSTTATPTVEATATTAPQTENGKIDATVLKNTSASSVNNFDVSVQTDGSATLTTNKADYAPTDTVLITGTGFIPNKTYTIEITSQDPPAVDFKDQVKADDKGNIIYSYQLDGTMRPNYTVYVKDGGRVVATTTFTDPNPAGNLEQCHNESGGSFADCKDPSSPSNTWGSGSAGSGNAILFEGNSQNYRLILTNMPISTPQTITIGQQFTKGGKMAYDFPTGPGNLGTATTPIGLAGIFPCDDNSGGLLVSPCPHLVPSSMSAGNKLTISPIPASTIPDVTVDGEARAAQTAYYATSESATPTRSPNFMYIYGATPGSFGGYSFIGTAGDVSGGDSELDWSFTVTPTSETVVIAWGAHISKSGDYGTKGTAVSISGDPYHTFLRSATWGNVGHQDMQMSAGAIVTTAPRVATAIHNASHVVVTSVPAGSTVHDSASVTGSAGTATGTVTFDFFNNGSCSSSPAATSSPFTLSGGAVDGTTFTQGPLSGGSYSFKAHYSGDSNYTPGDSACEPLTVTGVTPTISTTPNPSSGPLGTTLNDSTTLSGGVSPTGNIVFSLYSPSDSTCSSAATFTNTVSVSGNGTYNTSAGFTSNATGTWHWKAAYSGDGSNNAVTSACADEPVTVNKLSSTTVTEIHNASHAVVTSVDAGTTVHDKATVSGSGPTPTGTIDFTFYSGANNCTGDSVAAGTGISLVSGVAHPSSNEGPLNAGNYSFKAHYNGDSNYNTSDSSCEPLAVTQLTPTVTTNVHNANHQNTTSFALGDMVHDSASVSGSFGTPTGTVDFTFFNNGSCSPDGIAAGTGVGLVAGVAHPSSSEGPLSTGSYSFKAHYNGNTNYVAGDSSCEPLSVGKADTTVTTHVHNSGHSDITGSSVALGSQVHDNASVGTQVDGIAITGNVTYHFYTSGNCTGQPSDETVSLGSESTATSALGADSYSYKAEYSGDDNYNSSIGQCEPFSVEKSQLGLETTIHDADHNPVTSVGLGSTVHDRADVSGIIDGFGVPNVEFTFYTNGVCEGGSAAGSISVVAGVAHPSDSEGPLAAGSYSFKASIAGNDNYVGTTSACEPLTVEQGGSEMATTLHKADESTVTVGSSVPLSTVMHDLATVFVGGIFAPTGNVSFTFYNNNICEGKGTGMGSVTLDGANPGVAHPSNSTSALTAGDYSFKASWPGDNNYTGSTSGCENFTVEKADTSTSTQVHNASHDNITETTVPLGSTVHDNASVTGQVDAITLGGTVTYRFYNNLSCSGEFFGSETASVGSESSPQGPLSAGSYSYLAFYNGDNNYNGSRGECEPFRVGKGDTRVSTQVHNSNHNDITGSEVDPGTPVHDSATVSGQFDELELGGAVIYHFFTNGNCSGEPSDSEEVKVPGESSVKDNLGPGEYSYLADYSGDNNYNGARGICEPFTVSTPGISITKSNDKSGGTFAGDTVTYTLVITNTGNVTLNNVTITDALPGGFTYVGGSSTLDGSPIADPGISGGVLSWNIGTLTAGPGKTLVYKAHIASDLADGTYKNFATCKAFTGRQIEVTQLLFLGQEVDCNVADSSVPLGSGRNYGGNLTPQVLGAKTELPASGSETALLVLALGLGLTGVIIKVTTRRRKYAKN